VRSPAVQIPHVFGGDAPRALRVLALALALALPLSSSPGPSFLPFPSWRTTTSEAPGILQRRAEEGGEEYCRRRGFHPPGGEREEEEEESAGEEGRASISGSDRRLVVGRHPLEVDEEGPPSFFAK